MNNILGIKFCLTVQPTSEGSVIGCGLADVDCDLCLWVAVKAGKDMVGFVLV